MRLSRQYLYGVGSGLILSAMIALLFTPFTTESLTAVGANTTRESLPAETTAKAEETPSSQPSTASPQDPSSSEKTGSENLSQTPKSFVIPRGASAEKIAQLLQNEGWIQNKDDFLTIVKAKKLEKRFTADTYELTPGLSIENIIDQLIR